ncbi:MAG: formylglycine-generating enzyme family protein [Planctomycetaceae bacterium]|nr:formylglycine-generating enzyme family protein [Planctomycetaceae bacterium]
MTEPDPKKQSIIKAPNRAVAKARSNMASRALASVHKTTITNSIGMQLKLIPAGEFLMGSPESEPGRRSQELQHRVRITKPFYMQTTTVTQSQWTAVMDSEPWAGKDYNKEGADYPATYVLADDRCADPIVEFCSRLSDLENATYRLPTEAEWEYACRANSQTAYCFGDTADQLERYAWFRENTFDAKEEYYPHRVGQKLPNNFGLYDMHGNVWEWCSDWFDDYPSGPVTDPTGPAEGSLNAFRGGSWSDSAEDCRSAFRDWFSPSFQFDCSFRVAMSPSGK